MASYDAARRGIHRISSPRGPDTPSLTDLATNPTLAPKDTMPDNGFIESFNGRMPDELLNESLSFGLDHARSAIAEWREDFKTTRPHSTLGYQTPAAFAGPLAATGSDAALNKGFASPPVAQTAPNGVTERVEALGSKPVDSIDLTQQIRFSSPNQ